MPESARPIHIYVYLNGGDGEFTINRPLLRLALQYLAEEFSSCTIYHSRLARFKGECHRFGRSKPLVDDDEVWTLIAEGLGDETPHSAAPIDNSDSGSEHETTSDVVHGRVDDDDDMVDADEGRYPSPR